MQINTAGYRGIGPNRGQHIPAGEALAYACRQVGIRLTEGPAPDRAEFLADFLAWFYSGNYLHEEDEDDT